MVEKRMRASAETAHLTRVIVIADLDLGLFAGDILNCFHGLAEKYKHRTTCGNINPATDRAGFGSVSHNPWPFHMVEKS
jgi:hypothetical protein